MARLIFFIAILVLVCIALWKINVRLYWKIRNARNHGKGRVVKRKSKGKVVYVAQLYTDNVGWEDIPGLKYSNLSEAMTAMDNAMERAFSNENGRDSDEQIMVERSYRRR
jgi:hypothetical protein